MIEHTQPEGEIVVPRDWSAPLLERLHASGDMEAAFGVGEEAEGSGTS
jgi:hypothetical protein